MNDNLDKLHDRYADMDFAQSKPVDEIPALAKLQAEMSGKTCITMRIDRDILTAFKTRARRSGGSYQTLINDALRAYIQGKDLADIVRETIRETLRPC